MFPGNCSLMAALFRVVFVLLLPSARQSCGKGTVGISESLVLGSALSLAWFVQGRAGDIFLSLSTLSQWCTVSPSTVGS